MYKCIARAVAYWRCRICFLILAQDLAISKQNYAEACPIILRHAAVCIFHALIIKEKHLNFLKSFLILINWCELLALCVSVSVNLSVTMRLLCLSDRPCVFSSPFMVSTSSQGSLGSLESWRAALAFHAGWKADTWLRAPVWLRRVLFSELSWHWLRDHSVCGVIRLKLNPGACWVGEGKCTSAQCEWTLSFEFLFCYITPVSKLTCTHILKDRKAWMSCHMRSILPPGYLY